ncbi:MAG: DUF6348 family protein [Parvularculaceae bacterium]
MASADNAFPEFFSGMLTAHGVSPIKHNNWTTAGGGFPAFRGFFEKLEDKTRTGSVHIQVMLKEGVLIEETFAAFGASDGEAVKGAILSFNITMMHPILAACGVKVPENQITREVWQTADGVAAQVFCGNISTRYSESGRVSLPITWIGNIENAVAKTHLRDGHNWVTAYCARLNAEEVTASASLNNESWDAGLAATLKTEWPTSNGFYGARIFAVLVT